MREKPFQMVKAENSYEEARKKRVLENLKQLESFGISKISKSLLNVVKSECKPLKPKSNERSRKKFEASELRRSSRARNLVSYSDQVDEMELRSYRKRYCRSNDSGREYMGRYSSYEEQAEAFQRAQDIQSSLNNPSFVKAMVRSHVSSCFWLGLPSSFCKTYLRESKMVLEDEEGVEFDAVYIGSRTGLSGGWRGFAMEHDLEDGDALVFELTAPDRFKIYIVKALEDSAEDDGQKDAGIGNRAIALAKEEGEEEYEEKTPEITRSAKRSRKPRKSGSQKDSDIGSQAIELTEEGEEYEEKTPVTARPATRSRKPRKTGSQKDSEGDQGIELAKEDGEEYEEKTPVTNRPATRSRKPRKRGS